MGKRKSEAQPARKERSTSCYFCQRRKQKCDRQFPKCTTCVKAGVTCEHPAKYGMVTGSKDEAVVLLENKISHLQKMLELQTSGEPQQGSVSEQNSHRALYNLEIDEPAYQRSILGKYELMDFMGVEPVHSLDPKLSRQLLETYFALLQYKFPLLVEKDVLQFHSDYFSNRIASYGDFHFQCARMWLIFAISALLHMSTGSYRGPSPGGLFSTALRHSANLRDVTPLQKIEILILLVFYLIRSDRDLFVLFEVVTDAMKTCKYLNLHRRSGYENVDESTRDRRMRCFWCTYLLEKSIASAAGKPGVLQERQTDYDIPLFDHEPSASVFVNEAIKIRRIESRFIEELDLYNVDAKREQLPRVRSFFADLENWREDCKGFSRGIENETLSVYYCRSVRTLIQPFLELLDPEDRLFQECQAAAGQICQSLKSFHRKTVSGHSIVHIHTMFVAGVTLVYCLWLTRNVDDQRRKQLGDDSKHTRPTVSEALFRGLDDLRSCSVCLYVMAERTKYAKCFRDTFDDLMHATMENLILRCGPDSSEIIYNSSPGLPPAVVRKPLTNYALNVKLNMKATEAERKEEEDMRIRQGQLQRFSIPKGLNHLLSHAPVPGDLAVEEKEAIMEKASVSQLRSTLPSTQTSPVMSLQDSASSTDDATELSTKNFQKNAEVDLSSLVGRTNDMINNISVWTGESGQQFPPPPPEAPQEVKKEPVEFAVPFSEFWKGWDDFGFLP